MTSSLVQLLVLTCVLWTSDGRRSGGNDPQVVMSSSSNNNLHRHLNVNHAFNATVNVGCTIRIGFGRNTNNYKSRQDTITATDTAISKKDIHKYFPWLMTVDDVDTGLLTGGATVDDDNTASPTYSNQDEGDGATNEVVPIIVPPVPSGMEEDPDGIPTRFIQMQKGNRKAAADAYGRTLLWRKKYKIDNILNKPHTKYDLCKALVPHYFAGLDISGHIIFVQRPGLFNLEMREKNEINAEILLNHFVYCLEYCWCIQCPPISTTDNNNNKNNNNSSTKLQDCTMTSVLDFAGISWKHIKKQEYKDFASKYIQVMSAHYPSRSYKTLIINAPVWFKSVYKLFQPLLRESTRRKIEILSRGKRQDKVLLALLGDACPQELLTTYNSNIDDDGNSANLKLPVVEEGKPGPHSQIELEMRAHCLARIQAAGLTMEDYIC